MRNYNTVQTRQNIRKVWNSAHAAEVREGLDWYYDAHSFAYSLAENELYELYLSDTVTFAHLDTVEKRLTVSCAVVAVLSPQNVWETNKTDAKAMIQKYPAWEVPVSTFGLNKVKAIHIIETGDLSHKYGLHGQKVTRFFHNMRYPATSHSVTVDRHAISVLLGYNASSIEQRLTKAEYLTAVDAYVEVAEELDILPWQLQAVVWVAWHNRYAFQPMLDGLPF